MDYIPTVEISNGERMPVMIMGTFQHTSYKQLREIVRTGIEHGFNGFDTAYDYGNEADLGSILQECRGEFSLQREDLYLVDKIDIWQMAQNNGEVSRQIDEALQKLNTEYLDLLLIHWPLPGYFEKTWETFIDIYNQGKAKAIGVSNVRMRHLLQLVESTGFKPHVVQNERHPLRSDSEVFGYNQSNGIVLQAYSPVCRMIEPISNSGVLKNIAKKYGKTPGQVIMRWHIDTGSVPVFMTQKTKRIKEYAGVFSFALDKNETDIISSLDMNYKMTPESLICPGF
jgi:diketogulonate reductase-like aldo/keto reductase